MLHVTITYCYLATVCHSCCQISEILSSLCPLKHCLFSPQCLSVWSEGLQCDWSNISGSPFADSSVHSHWVCDAKEHFRGLSNGNDYIRPDIKVRLQHQSYTYVRICWWHQNLVKTPGLHPHTPRYLESITEVLVVAIKDVCHELHLPEPQCLYKPISSFACQGSHWTPC